MMERERERERESLIDEWLYVKVEERRLRECGVREKQVRRRKSVMS